MLVFSIKLIDLLNSTFLSFRTFVTLQSKLLKKIMDNINVEKWLEILKTYASEYGFKVLGAILIWIVGSFIIKK